ncbi:hypothetical protein [Thiocapsa bogorovii]|uniref:hypothetical protein n=1 Tax=Thiocapsa bogorovii TaxID=521689 RepID=UPI001E33243B|nr:hypothetical protein [Thiocapsa bogorovii]UHD16235.1 hypothetical protein LT988_23815 [Thiocapsa bogorovii]
MLLLLFAPMYGILAAVVSKPIIDMGWDAGIAIFGLRPMDLIGVGLPAVLLIWMASSAAGRPRPMQFLGIWCAYLLCSLLGALMMAVGGDMVGSLSFMFRILNGFVGFYMFQTYFADRDRFKKLLLAMLIGGLVPMLMGFYESVTGDLFRVRQGVGDQIRIAGLYHNSIAYRYFAYITLTGIGLYWVYFTPKSQLKKWLLAAYAIIALVVLYRVYSKAGFASLALALLLGSIAARRILPVLVLGVVLVTVNSFMAGEVFDEVSTTFLKETSVLSGEEDTDRLFSGRVGGWKSQLDYWSDGTLENKLFGGRGGGRDAKGGGHNDYIRALLQTGSIGLAAYILLLAVLGFRIFQRFLSDQNWLNTVAAILYCMWIIDSIGLTPAVYTHFQWYVWGFVGLAMRGVKGLGDDKRKNEVVVPRRVRDLKRSPE